MLYVVIAIAVLALGGCLYLWAKLETVKELIVGAHFESFSGGGTREMLMAYNKLWAWAGLDERGAPGRATKNPVDPEPRERTPR